MEPDYKILYQNRCCAQKQSVYLCDGTALHGFELPVKRQLLADMIEKLSSYALYEKDT